MRAMSAMQLFVLLATVLAGVTGTGFAADANLSQAVLFNDDAYPNYLRMSNVEALGNYYWALFKWNNDRNSLDLVRAGIEADTSFAIPSRTIAVDGNDDDWAGLTPVLVDSRGDDYYETPGDDITEVYIARDSNFMYFAIRTADGTPLSAGNGHLHFQFSLTADGWGELIQLENHFAVFVSVLYYPPNWSVATELHVVNPLSPRRAIPVRLAEYDSGTHLGVGSDFVEWKVPVKDCMITSGRYAEAWTHYDLNPAPSDLVKGVRLK